MSNLVIYCLNCASPNYYTLTKPNFCSGCGKSFNSNGPGTAAGGTIHTPRPIKQVVLKPLPKEVDLDEEYSDVDNVPNVSQDEVFAIEGVRDQGIKIQDIAVGKKVGKIEDKVSKGGKKAKFDKKSFLQSYQEQAKGGVVRDTTPVPED